MMMEMEEERRRQFLDAAMPYLDAVYSRARFLTRNTADAEDAVQECYVRALRHFDDYRGPSVRAWLFAILRNLCFTEFSRRGRCETLAAFPEDEEEMMWQAPRTTPETMLERRQEDGAIRRLVDALPAPFRDVILLREFDELSYKEIAEITGSPVGTVMSRLARARAILRTALQGGKVPVISRREVYVAQ